MIRYTVVPLPAFELNGCDVVSVRNVQYNPVLGVESFVNPNYRSNLRIVLESVCREYWSEVCGGPYHVEGCSIRFLYQYNVIFLAYILVYDIKMCPF